MVSIVTAGTVVTVVTVVRLLSSVQFVTIG